MASEVESDDDRVVAWLERTFSARVAHWSRQPRWRPMWFCELEMDGSVEQVLVRGTRIDTPLIFPLEHEMLFQRLLHERGIPVPRVHGMLDDPQAFAMEVLPGRPDFAAVPDPERDVIVDEYLQVLAALHALPVEPFKQAGIAASPAPAGAGLVGCRRFEDHYRSEKVRPDPLVEFVLGWLRRHPLPASEREAPVVWDSGQFHHQDGHLVGIVDLELGHVGDPMMDLAGWRMRDTVIPYGDFSRIYDRYADLTGRPVDLAAIQWHHLFFTLTNQLSFHRRLADPTSDTDYMTYAQWISETNLHAIETLAEYLGIALEPVDVPEPITSPAAAVYAHLVASLRDMQATDDYTKYQLRAVFRLARHIQRYDQVGATILDADREDLCRLLGRAPASWEAGEAELERFILSDDGAHDDELVVLLYRRWQRYKALMGPPGSAMATHHTMQPLGPSLLANS